MARPRLWAVSSTASRLIPGGEVGLIRIERDVGVQGLQAEVFDPAALPLALFGLVLVVPQHGREVRERGEEFVLAG